MQYFFQLSVGYGLLFTLAHCSNLFEMWKDFKKTGKADSCKGTLMFFGFCGALALVWWADKTPPKEWGVEFTGPNVAGFALGLIVFCVVCGWILPLIFGGFAEKAFRKFDEGTLKRKLIYGSVWGAVCSAAAPYVYFSLIFS